MTKTQGNVVIFLLGCLLVVAGAHVILTLVTAVWPTVFQLSSIGSYAPEPTLTAAVDLPDEVVVGEEFELLVEATNPHDKPVVLGSIDLESSFIRGFEVVSVTPNAVEDPDYYSYQRWNFSKSIEPGGSLRVKFRLRAVRIGQFAGDIDVCNPNEDCTTQLVIIRVNDKPSTD